MNLLGLDGFEVIDDETVTDGRGHPVERRLTVRTVSPVRPVCCLVPQVKMRGTKNATYRDLKMGNLPTKLVVRQQRWSCHCGRLLTEVLPHVESDHMVTTRLRDAVRLSAVKRTFADVVAVHGVEERLATRIFRTYADEELLRYRYKAPRVLGIDENVLLGGKRGVIVDVEAGKLLDVLPGADGSAVRRGLDRMEEWENVEVWCQDMAGGYKGIAQQLFPKATIVVDKFHVLVKANHWFMKVRVEETRKLPPEVSKLIPGLIRVFDMREGALSDRQRDRVADVLSHSRRLSDAYAIKESFYYWYDSPTRQDAEAAYAQWVAFVRSKDQLEEWKSLLRMMARERAYIFTYFDHRYTSGVVERMNRSIGDINRAANGMDFQTLRAKAILRYGNLVEEDRLRYFFMQHETPDWLIDVLDEEAHLEDGPEDDRVLLGSGFDPGTLLADLKAGRFDALCTPNAG